MKGKKNLEGIYEEITDGINKEVIKEVSKLTAREMLSDFPKKKPNVIIEPIPRGIAKKLYKEKEPKKLCLLSKFQKWKIPK